MPSLNEKVNSDAFGISPALYDVESFDTTDFTLIKSGFNTTVP